MALDPLGVLAGKIGVAVVGGEFDGVAAAENHEVDFAHLCGGWYFVGWI